jgi:DNA-binding LacI/PurR family transcriptional regulator
MLAQGNNYLIGVFAYHREFPYETDDFFFPYLTGIQREASDQGFNVLLFTRYQNTQGGVYTNSMNSLLLADGSILLGGNPIREELRRLYDEDYPFVFIGRREVTGRQLNWVSHDYQTGAAEAMAHLLLLGHRRIAFIATHAAQEPQEDKLAGCRRALEHYPDAHLMSYQSDSFDPPDTFIDELSVQHITAVICDYRIGFEQVLHLLHAANLRVPDDMSVISMTTADNALPYMLKPSHVQLDQRAVGMMATRILVTRINGQNTGPQQTMLPCRFVAGQTTGPPRL